MAKISRYGGATDAGGVVERRKTVVADLDVLGRQSDTYLAGGLRVVGDASIDGDVLSGGQSLVSRVTTLESGLAVLETDLATLDSTVSAHTGDSLSEGAHSEFGPGGNLAVQRLSAGAGVLTGSATWDTAGNGRWGGARLNNGVTAGLTLARSWASAWQTGDISLAFVALNAGTPRNVRWRITVDLAGVFGVPTSTINDTPDVETLVTDGLSNQFVMDHLFNVTGGFNLHLPSDTFGTVTSVSVERLGGDALDTYVGDVLLTGISLLRVT